MKSRNRYFWIFMFFMCGVNLVCSSVVLGHLTEWTVRIRNGYPTPPASITNGDITTTFVAGSFTHPSGNGNNQYHDPVTRLEDCDTTGSNFYHEHQFKIMWDNTADSNSAIESTVRGEWYCSPTRRKIKDPQPLSSSSQPNPPQSTQQSSQQTSRSDQDSSPPIETFSPPPEPQFLPEDVNQDSTVDNEDLVDIAMHFGETPTGDLVRYDLDGDGDIDPDDFQLIQAQVGQGETPGAPAALLTHQEQLQRIVELNNPGAIVQILNQPLKRQLPPPKETVLLRNYPNPFNPETWIPYRLAKAADVTLTIYATNGQPVRTLALGHQPVGSYLDRTRAAYWDGKNAFGESVASGLYFYTLTADDFSATRKMLVAK